MSQLRNEIIQDDSEDEMQLEQQYESSQSSKKDFGLKSKGENKVASSSYESNPLQRIIEQRMLESSTDSEESEEELDDDYDIGIDDVDLGTEDQDDIHTATVSLNSMSSSLPIVARSIKDEQTIIKKQGISPFTDVIEKGLASYMGNHSRLDTNLDNVQVN